MSSDNPRPSKEYEKSSNDHDALDASADGLSDEQLKQFSRRRLLKLAKQKRAPAVAKSAAAELSERVEPKKGWPEAQVTTKSSSPRRSTTVNFDDGMRESLASIPLSNLREAERAKKQKDDEKGVGTL